MNANVKSNLDREEQRKYLETVSNDCLTLSREKFRNVLEYKMNSSETGNANNDGKQNFGMSLTSIWPTFYQFKSLRIEKEPDNSELLASLQRRELMNEIRLKNICEDLSSVERINNDFQIKEKESDKYYVTDEKERKERLVKSSKTNYDFKMTISSLNSNEKEKIDERKREIELFCINIGNSQIISGPLQSTLPEETIFNELPSCYVPCSMEKSIQYETRNWIRKNPKSIENFKRLIL